jgi:hypothetical protein
LLGSGEPVNNRLGFRKQFSNGDESITGRLHDGNTPALPGSSA